MLTLAIASVCHYFNIYTFHAEHYWSVLFLEYALLNLCQKLKRYC